MTLPEEIFDNLVEVPPGDFILGEGAEEDDGSVHRVAIKLTRCFKVSKYLITQGVYRAVTGLEPWENPIRDPISPLSPDDHQKLVINSIKIGPRFPAVMVSQLDAQDFCEKASRLLVKKLRLPTEAEWEWACRAGTRTSCYWGGGIYDSKVATPYAWHKAFGANAKTEMKEVGMLSPNEFGLYDMSGLAKEWVSGRYEASGMNVAKSNYRDEMKDPIWENGQYAMLRNGGFKSTVNGTMSSYKVISTDENKSYDIGFRVVVETT
jgi:formylglycine-generating enzyme required for sulfatase activity